MTQNLITVRSIVMSISAARGRRRRSGRRRRLGKQSWKPYLRIKLFRHISSSRNIYSRTVLYKINNSNEQIHLFKKWGAPPARVARVAAYSLDISGVVFTSLGDCFVFVWCFLLLILYCVSCQQMGESEQLFHARTKPMFEKTVERDHTTKLSLRSSGLLNSLTCRLLQLRLIHNDAIDLNK